MPCLVPAEDGGDALSEVPGGRALLFEVSMGPVRLRGIRERRLLFLRARQPLEEWSGLYDVVNDPDERRDLSDKRTAESVQLAARLDAFFEALEATALTARSRELDAQTAAHLEAIGYTTGD